MNASKRVVITTQPYFEGSISILGWLLIITSLLTLPVNQVISIICLLFGILIVTTRYQLRIDEDNKEIKEYLWILGMEKGEVIPYQQLERIFYKETVYNQQLNSRGNSTKIRVTQYSGYLVADDKKYFLGDNQNKENLQSKINDLGRALKVKVEFLESA